MSKKPKNKPAFKAPQTLPIARVTATPAPTISPIHTKIAVRREPFVRLRTGPVEGSAALLPSSAKELTSLVNYNPDVLSCLANLSNDEVFTPPELANKMLDLLPSELWQDKNATFLDPVTKSGVFLREIAKRLNAGLAAQIPDTQARMNHIFTQQLYGIAITELTGLLARRSVYCAKHANSALSICTAFGADNEQGNILFKRVSHRWVGLKNSGKCSFCGASEAVYDRDDALENHAYAFIHTDTPQALFGANMKFDVIIGNPPYQLNVGVEKENYAIALYHLFVQQAKKLNPRFLSMIIPARWYAGGRGLDEFRAEMLADKHIRTLVDYPNAVDCFAGIDLAGGACYFLWERDSEGDCDVTTVIGTEKTSTTKRPLLEQGANTFIRFNQAISILRKIKLQGETTFDKLVSPQTPFGLTSTFKNYKTKAFEGSVKLHTSSGVGFVDKENIPRNLQWVNQWKVYISKAYGERGGYPYLFLGRPFLGEQNSCCTQTYLLIGGFKSKEESENVMTFVRTKFFRFCIISSRSKISPSHGQTKNSTPNTA
jgi:site-specific DNA-methyltransferase (adenine-specific)